MSMASPLTSKVSFVGTDGEALDAPREWTPELIEVAISPEQLQRSRLLCQGAQLPLYVQELAGQLRVLAQWPRSGTGQYRFLLELDDLPAYETVCTVRPRKISEESYSALISDLQGDRLPTSIAVGLEATGGLAGLELRYREETTLTQERLRLRRAVLGTETRAGLASALRAIARDPHRLLTKSEEWVPAERARRLEPVGLIQALRAPRNLDYETHQPLQVPDVRVEHTLDVYENRLVKLYYEQVSLRLRRLLSVVEANNLLAMVSELETLRDMLGRARRDAAFLDEVTRPRQLPTRITMVLLRRSPYRAVLEGFVEFRRETYVQLDEPSLDAPLEGLPDLYQAWGTLQVIDVLLELAQEYGYETTEQRLAKQFGGGIYVKVLAVGEPALVLVRREDDRVVRLIPERSFTHSSKPHRSISFPQRPDVTVEVGSPLETTTLLLFDPKYKLRSEDKPLEVPEEVEDLAGPLGKPKKIDIDKMHAYRDAIRSANDERVVTSAAILYPGPATQYGDGIEALSAVPSEPGPLRERLRAILESALA
jgi:predicted component of viral defense system (DUF524 family)